MAFLRALNIAAGNPKGQLVIFHVIPKPSAQFWKSYVYEVESVDPKAKPDIDEKTATSCLSRIPKGMKWSTRFAVGRVNQQILEAAPAKRLT